MKIILFLFALSLYAKQPSFVMGALGDSITTAFNSYHLFSEKDGSWSTGDEKYPDFESHKMKIEKLIEKPVKAFNMAIPGATAESLVRQVKKLLRHAPKPDYVTILIGANDVCSWDSEFQEDLEDYKNNVIFAVKKIINANPHAKILLVPIPNMNRLYELGKYKESCRVVWDLIPLCKPLFDWNVTDNERGQFAERVKDINSKLKEISELYPSNAFYYEVLEEVNFDEKHVSEIDCFHPSAYGQKMIAEYTFNRDLFTEWLPPQPVAAK
jgi:lysophospholipase L1-like esterase